MKIKRFLDDYIAPALPSTLDTAASICLNGMASAIIPGVGNLMIAYRQRQQEKQFELAISELQKRQEEIDAVLERYEDDMAPIIKKLLELYLDYSIENNQDEKIELLANGYVNSIKVENPQVDVLLGFYDTLSQVNLLDIRVLRLYKNNIILEHNNNDDDYLKIIHDYEIDHSQYEMIQKKLVRLGLLENKNDTIQDKNIEYIIEYLQAANKDKINDAKRALNKVKKISARGRYTISSYGKSFLKFFCEKDE